MAKSAVRSKARPAGREKRNPVKPVAKKKATTRKAAVKPKPTARAKSKKVTSKSKPKAAVKGRAAAKKAAPKTAPVKPKPAAKKAAARSKTPMKSKPKPKAAAKATAPAKPAARGPRAKSTAKPKAPAPAKSKLAPVKAVAEPPVVVRKPLPPRPKPKPEVIRKAKRVNFDTKTLQSIKADLSHQRVELSQQIKEIEEATFNSTQSEMSGETGYDEDSADAGTATFEREKDLSIANNIQDLIDKIDKALHKIDEGTYGLCESCGDPISAERLKALPYVLLCIRCKKAEERR